MPTQTMSSIKLGFTGTRRGMTEAQRNAVKAIFQNWNVGELHHGDCIGADATASNLAQEMMSIKTIIHPPVKSVNRAFCTADEIREKKAYHIRNRDIVNDTDRLIATPYENKERLRSGTWATIRYAILQGKPVFVVLPNGSCRSL